MTPTRSIFSLAEHIRELSPVEKDRFDRIYRFTSIESQLHIPLEMRSWVTEQFGSVESVTGQQIARVVNRVTGEGTLFNELRARRPNSGLGSSLKRPHFEESSEDLLANPLDLTPEDPFGRLENRHGITAANIARFDALHSLVIFKEFNPLAFTQESLTSHINLAQDWIAHAHTYDPKARYPYILWNCLWRAGGSLVHGHLQVALTREMHYSKIERLRRDAEAYRQQYNTSYFEDLSKVHLSLGCGHIIDGSNVLSHLTPVREKEVLILAPNLSNAISAIFKVLTVYRDTLNVTSFNMGVIQPPLSSTPESWEKFPVLIRILDRGDISSHTSDIGAMELFAESVVATDPFIIAAALANKGVD